MFCGIAQGFDHGKNSHPIGLQDGQACRMQNRASVRWNTDSSLEVCCQRIPPVSRCLVVVGDHQTRFKHRKPLAHRRNGGSLVLNEGKSGEWTPHDMRQPRQR